MTRTTKQDATDRMDQATGKVTAAAEEAFGRQANKGILADKVAEAERTVHRDRGDLAAPLDLQGTLPPNVTPATRGAPANDPYLMIEVLFRTQSQNATPRLKSLTVGWKCNSIG